MTGGVATRVSLQVERLEKEHVSDSRSFKKMEEAGLRAQSRLKASERSVTEQANRYEALELVMQKLQLKMSVCDGERSEPRTSSLPNTLRVWLGSAV